MSLDQLLGLVDEGLLAYTEETRDGVNRARLIQGDPSFEKDATLNKTVRYLGGIGLSVDNLPEEILQRGTVVTLESGDWVTFPSLDVVVLASARVRRYFGQVEGQTKLMCGTNQDGQNAMGWRGIACSQCEYWPKNWTANGGDKKDACGASVEALVYFPELDHTAVLTMRGASYMDGTHWLEQVATLSKKFAARPEVQAKQPGLQRVNSYFFKSTLSASAFKTGNDNNKFQSLAYEKATAPYEWDKWLNTPAVIAKAKKLLGEGEEVWKRLYVEPNTTAVLVASSPAPAALPVQKVTMIAAAPTEPPQAAVTTVVMDDDDDDAAVSAQTMTF